MNISILPAGAWGTAMAIHLAREGNCVTLIPRTLEEAISITKHRENKAFFPGYHLPQSIQIGFEYKPALLEANAIILACPSKFLRSVCRELRNTIPTQDTPRLKTIITLCKGLEEGSNELPSQILEKELPNYTQAVLSGPSFASQVASGHPTAVVLASKEAEKLKGIQEALSGSTFRTYTSNDVVGVELGGCLKNVYAIAAGICDGLKFADNTKAALLTRALNEMIRVGIALGGQANTFYGLSGVGDLMLTCNGQESRNRTFGERFAKGEAIKTLIQDEGMTVEGYRTCKCFYEKCQNHQIDAPILNEIYQILFEKKGAQEALASLMSRKLKSE